MEKGKNNGGGDKEIIRIDLDDSETDSNGDNSNPQAAVNGNSDAQSDEKLSKALRKFMTGDMKFMSNFDPELSNREKRKLSRKINQDGGGKRNNSLYDENGILRGLGKDLCDCLDDTCLGCHFPCPKCRSCKCGHECRVNRKWMIELIENEGDKVVTKNNIQINNAK